MATMVSGDGCINSAAGSQRVVTVEFPPYHAKFNLDQLIIATTKSVPFECDTCGTVRLLASTDMLIRCSLSTAGLA